MSIKLPKSPIFADHSESPLTLLLQFLPQTSVNTTKRLSDLRSLMRKQDGGIQGYIVPSTDAHQVQLLFYNQFACSVQFTHKRLQSPRYNC